MSALLIFNPAKKVLCEGLSAVAQIGDTLWVVNDDTLSLERLTLREPDGAGDLVFDRHQTFSLAPLLTLPIPPQAGEKDVEADIEGLDVDAYAELTHVLTQD